MPESLFFAFVLVTLALIVALGFVAYQRDEARDERDTARRALNDACGPSGNAPSERGL